MARKGGSKSSKMPMHKMPGGHMMSNAQMKQMGKKMGGKKK